MNPEKVINEDFEGWGASLAWWAEEAGRYHENDEATLDELSEMLINDLNFTTFRYNIGGSCDPTIESECELHNIGLNPQRTVPNMDAPDRGLNQRRMLKSLAKVGEENGIPMKFESFSNSPPYWMLKSGSPTGGYKGANNLKESQYDEFAEYLVRATGYLNDDLAPYGFEVESIEPFNEPLSGWWNFSTGNNPGTQEGCSFSYANQYKLINLLYDELDAQGVDAFLAANDHYKMDAEVPLVYQEMGLMGKVERYNFHDYHGDIKDRKELKSVTTAFGKKLWISEGGPIGVRESPNPYIYFVRFMDKITKDIKYLRPDRWIDWQTLDTHPKWTAIDYEEYMETGNLVPNKRFYLLQHYTNHYRIGDAQMFTSLDAPSVLAFRSADETELSVLILNETEEEVEYQINLSDFSGMANASVEYWLTDEEVNSHTQQSNVSLDASGYLNLTMLPHTLATYVVPISGGTSTCAATALSPSYQIGDGGAVSGTSITIDAGQDIVFSPQPNAGGDWEWSGLGTSGTAREQTIAPLESGTVTATFTNNCGATSVLNFDVTVNAVDCTPTAIVPKVVVDGVEYNEATATVQAGYLLKIEPSPLEGGSWSWSGCGVAAEYSDRELILHPEEPCTVTATYTNPCGAQSTLDFEINIEESDRLEDGIYQVKNRLSDKCLVPFEESEEPGARIVQTTCSDNASQRWRITYLGSEVFVISHIPSGKVFDINALSVQPGGLNIIWGDNGGDNQRWNIVHQFDEYYHIANVNSNLILDIEARSLANNAQSIQWTDNGGGNQDWSFEPVVSSGASARFVGAVDTGVELSNWAIAPNPVFDGYLSVMVSDDMIGGQVTVSDFSGREYFNGSIVEQEQQLQLSGLATGVYFVNLQKGELKEVRKLLVR